MGRSDDIAAVFRARIRISENGRRTVTTADFVRTLSLYGHEWGMAKANRWVEHYQLSFRDVSTEPGECRTFRLFNSNKEGR